MWKKRAAVEDHDPLDELPVPPPEDEAPDGERRRAALKAEADRKITRHAERIWHSVRLNADSLDSERHTRMIAVAIAEAVEEVVAAKEKRRQLALASARAKAAIAKKTEAEKSSDAGVEE
jgi:hypothetical protein